MSRILKVPLLQVFSLQRRSFTSNIKASSLSPAVRKFIDDSVRLCRPDNVYVCDGSEKENQGIIAKLIKDGRLTKLTKYDNCYLARTDPRDVARVENQTYVCTERKEDTVPISREGVVGTLGNWKAPNVMDQELNAKFQGCMTGRTMYVIPFCMGPVGSPLAKIGIELTDSEYVVASMRVMTRMGKNVLDALGNGEFIKCLHSVGWPLKGGQSDVAWPCNPEKVAVVHFPERNEIKSFGSGYGGNSLLGKKGVALRIASVMGRKEGWLAEHTLILGLTNPKGVKKYVVAAFPSACGKTNLAMINPTLPGWKAECVGDDIAWMKFDSNGCLRAINPEAGFFGVAPGTSSKTNSIAMASIFKDTIFTNVAETSDGGVFWEGLEKEVDFSKISIKDWKGRQWTPGTKSEAAQPNSRFCTPAKHCPAMDSHWEDPEGVPIDAILFGGRRPNGIPLVYEAFNWRHGVFVGASMRSEATAAAEHRGKEIMHDPFAMRPFFGYSFVQYLQHWLTFERKPGLKLPKIFHVNWFRKDDQGQFLWPGFGDNSRVLDWILRRCNQEDIAMPSAIGLLPKPGSINTKNLKQPVDMEAIFKLSKSELNSEAESLEKYFNDQLPGQLPLAMKEELVSFKQRIAAMPQ